MTKQTKKPTTRKTAGKKSAAKVELARRSDFQRWLLPGLLAIALYLFAALVGALIIKKEGGIPADTGWIVTTLLAATLVCVAWWLFESARSIIRYIDRRSAKK